jgi:GxxExxY protein
VLLKKNEKITENKMELLHEDLTDSIIKTFFDVYNELGYGFLEKVYQNSLFIELKNRGFKVEAQKQIKVYYKNVAVGQYYADLVVNDLIILELKAAEGIIKEFEFQLINYLKATEIEVGLLLNFGMKPEFRRKVFENSRKNNTLKQ